MDFRFFIYVWTGGNEIRGFLINIRKKSLSCIPFTLTVVAQYYYNKYD